MHPAVKKKDANKPPQTGPKKDQKEVKEIKKEEDPARLVGHWEKYQINTVSGKESWWVYVKSIDDPAKFPLRRRIPPDCIHCGNKVLVEDEIFSRYGVEWQPLCMKCYSNGNNVPLKNGKPSKGDFCYWCLATDEVKSDICKDCVDYVSGQVTNFGISKTEALTHLYYYQTGLRNSRRILINK